MQLRAMVVLVLALALGAGTGQAQDNGGRLRVGVVERPPFAIRTSDGAWLGMAVDLWRLAAEDLGLAYRYAALDREQAADALAAGEVDLALPLDATPGLEQTADLTHPIYTATMGVATERQARVLSVVQGFASWQFLRLVLGLSALLLVVGALVWLLERRRNGEQFHRGILKGLGDGFWWAGVTLTTIGYGDKAPVTAAGRAVAMLWMLTGLAVSAALTAAVVTLAGVNQQVDVPEVFGDRRVGVVTGSSAELFLQREQARLRAYDSIPAALRGLNAGEVEVVAAPAPALRHVVSESGAFDLNVRTTRLDPHHVGIALPAGSDLRDPLNVALLGRLSNESGWNLIDRYLPE